ncbi:MAG: hypothetical protein WCH98_07055 [Verrucomicrobiota bacterium]
MIGALMVFVPLVLVALIELVAAVPTARSVRVCEVVLEEIVQPPVAVVKLIPPVVTLPLSCGWKEGVAASKIARSAVALPGAIEPLQLVFVFQSVAVLLHVPLAACAEPTKASAIAVATKDLRMKLFMVLLGRGFGAAGDSSTCVRDCGEKKNRMENRWRCGVQ